MWLWIFFITAPNTFQHLELQAPSCHPCPVLCAKAPRSQKKKRQIQTTIDKKVCIGRKRRCWFIPLSNKHNKARPVCVYINTLALVDCVVSVEKRAENFSRAFHTPCTSTVREETISASKDDDRTGRTQHPAMKSCTWGGLVSVPACSCGSSALHPIFICNSSSISSCQNGAGAAGCVRASGLMCFDVPV